MSIKINKLQYDDCLDALNILNMEVEHNFALTNNQIAAWDVAKNLHGDLTPEAITHGAKLLLECSKDLSVLASEIHFVNDQIKTMASSNTSDAEISLLVDSEPLNKTSIAILQKCKLAMLTIKDTLLQYRR